MDDLLLDNDFSQVEEEKVPQKYAGFWIRVLASFLDTLVLFPIGFLSIYNLFTYQNLPLQIIITVVSAIYKPYMEWNFGATLGKMVTNLKVIGMKTEKITLTQTMIRSSPWLLPSIINFFLTFSLFSIDGFVDLKGGLSFDQFMQYTLLVQQSDFNLLSQLASWPMIIAAIIVAFDSKKQGLHDMFAKTYCVYKN